MIEAIKFEGRIIDPNTYMHITGICMLNGLEVHVQDGLLHRNPKEGPAMVDAMGAKHYIKEGKTDRIVYPWQTEVKPEYKIIVHPPKQTDASDV